MNLKKISLVLVVSTLMIFISSCSKDDSTGGVSLKAKAINNNPTSKVMFNAKSSANIITISSFKININEIEFEVEDQDEQNEDLYSDFELKGPFELDLSNGNFSVDITTVELPNNVYSEIEFDLHKSTNTSSELYGKSIQIKGTLNGTPFVFWHDVEDEIEVDFPNSSTNISVAENQLTVVITFDLTTIFGSTSTIDFSSALDRNGNGVIEINPSNADGNAAIAHQIKNLLKENSNLDDDD
ncbi:MAG: hypothetical protein Q8S44_03975 [Flavobacteriaceae bacterium]|nr:hypothetical protein [Flavobacteriaceae bacterium]